ncbi:50S ribosomal protein L10 [Candidatus Parcubacteria bacterium]|nr:50S ribosomal protein L10 [Candidatus Parcubacteria bacterium]
MALTKEQKQNILEDLEEKIKKQKALIFVDFTGVKVKNLSELRKELKSNENELKVAKKTLMNIALKKLGIEIEPDKLKGEIGLTFGYKDGLSLAKTIYQFSLKNENLKILGGYFEKKFLDAEQIIELAKLPSKEELLARFVGSISSPISNFVNVLQGNIKGLIYTLKQIKV